MLVEKIKKLSSKEEVFGYLDKHEFWEFMKFFEQIDETVKNEPNSSFMFSNKDIAKLSYEYGIKKIYENVNFMSSKNFVKFATWEDKKFILNLKEIEQYFVLKDEEFIRDMFEIFGRMQLAKIGLKDELRELNYEKNKINIHFSNLKKFIIKKTFELNALYIKQTYKIAKRKIEELKMLFTFNGDVFHKKSKNKNIIDFNNEKANIRDEIKSDLKAIDKKQEKIVTLEKEIQIYNKGIDYDYDYDFKVKTASAKIEHLKKKSLIEEKCTQDIIISKKHLNEIKGNVQKYKNHLKVQLGHLKEEFKTKVNYAITKNEIRDVKLNYKQDRKSLIQGNEFNRAKADLRYKNHVKKTELKKEKITFISNIENINNSIPVEIPKWKIYLSLILSVIPGVGQLINKQYKKGTLMLSLFVLVSAFLLYGFEIGNIEGRGILGLIDFGASVTNSDGRFYLIEGIISIILISLSIIIILASVLDARKIVKQQWIGVRARSWTQTNEFLKNQGTPYLLSLPAIIGILFIVLVPIIATIIIAFTNYGRGNDPARPGQIIEWVGFANFAEIFGGRYSSSFGYVMLWTVGWVLFASLGSIVAGTLAALLVNNDRLKFKGFFRLFLILPWAVPAFIMIMMFSLLFANESFNEFTRNFLGVDGWTNQQTQARIALIFIQSWLGQSYMFLLITGILQGVSKDIYDASSIDGASKFKQTLRLTLPIVFGQVAPLILGQFTFNFGNFGIISLYGANGVALGPDGFPYPGEPGITDILISFVYRLSTNPNSYTYGLAASFIIVSSFVVVSISAVGFKNMKAFKN